MAEAPRGTTGPAVSVPVDELHDEEHASVFLAEVVDGDDVGVGELPGGGLGFAGEALRGVGPDGGAGEELEGDGASEGKVARAI